jgi:uncharacterized membrane protein
MITPIIRFIYFNKKKVINLLMRNTYVNNNRLLKEMSGLTETKGKSSTGMDENVAALLTYVFGLVTGILFLVIEKESKFVRFHAFQSILISAAFIILNMVLGFIPIIGWLISLLLSPVGFILWLILLYQAYQGKWFKLPVIGDYAEEQSNKLQS